ncbi:WD repeat-containing protein 89 [Papilio xuthus]|uniref:WD repeat-containing protein 89 n=1 Tax=Papilio xuthus TaxID=66420 RepID=A0A194PM43_PAPXU|nr:WD repeat-containing protein 89 [Papilio xuthus]
MDIFENEEADKDTVEENELEEQFPKKYDLMTEIEVSLKKTYINKISGTKTLKYSIILPDNTIEVYEVNDSSLSRVCSMSGHEKTVTETVFNPNDDNILFSTSEDGLVKMWDTRAGGSCVLDYKDEEEKIIRPYECLDVSYNGRVLCTGSQLVEDDAYLVFWDQRAPKPLGGYWNTHTDDVTQVKFHKEKVEILATGSVDGLVNVFNIMEQTEDEALTHTLNAKCAVDKLAWVGGAAVACLTQAHQLQLWSTASARCALHCERQHIAGTMKRSRADDCYLVDTVTSVGGRPVLLAGSYGGEEKTLRALVVAGGRLLPYANFARNRQLVRCCHHDQARDLLVTAGESGIVSVWRGVPDHTGLDDADDLDHISGIDADLRDGDHVDMDASDKSDNSVNSDDSDKSKVSDKPDDSVTHKKSGPLEHLDTADSNKQETLSKTEVSNKAYDSDKMDSSDESFESSETEGGEVMDDVSGKLTGALARLQARRHRPY